MKKILAIFISLCLLVSSLPATVIALGNQEEGPATRQPAEHSSHYACSCVITGDTACSHEGDPLSWSPWNGKTTITGDGNYYLTDDVTLTSAIGLYGKINLCLHGHTIQADSSKLTKHMIQVGHGTVAADVTIMDCQTKQVDGQWVYKGGLTGGRGSNGSGGAIQLGHVNLASSLELIGVQISDCQEAYNGNKTPANNEQYGGGAIHVRNGVLETNYAHFADNQATSTVGTAKYGAGGAISVYLGSVIAKNTEFTGNQASLKGGALYLRASSNATATLENCKLTQNGAEGYGAAVYVGKNCSLSVTDTELTGNTAGKNGTIYSEAATITMTDAVVKGNVGGLFIGSEFATVTLAGSTKILENTNAQGSGAENAFLNKNKTFSIGALGADADIHIGTKDTDATLAFLGKHTDFKAEDWSEESSWLTYDNVGMRILYDKTEDKFYLAEQLPDAPDHSHGVCSCLVAGTSCDHTQEAWVAWESNNSLPNDASKRYYLTQNVVLSKKQTITNDVTLCLNGHTISAAENYTGTLFQAGTAGEVVAMTLMNCKAEGGIENAVSSTGGGAVQVGHASQVSSLSLLGVAFRNNTEAMGNQNYGGGALHVRNGNLVLEHCTFENNKATGVKDGENVGAGGAISIYLGTVTAKHTTFTGNEATFGGAIFVRGDSNAVVTLENCTLTQNVATSYGAAVYMGKSGSLNVTDTELTNNTAGKNGTIYAEAATITLTNATVKDNVGGLFVGSEFATVTVAGDTKVLENANNENIYLKKNKLLLVGRLTAGADIHVATATTDASVAFVGKGTDFAAEDWSEESTWLTYDNVNTSILYDKTEDKFYIVSDTPILPEQPEQPEHSHGVCSCLAAGTSCDHAQEEWVAWTDSTRLPNDASKRYYLTTNVVMSKKQNITRDVTLCLNGHTISAAEDYVGTLFQAGTGSEPVTMTLMNCKADGGIENAVSETGGGAVQVGHVNQASSVSLLGVAFRGNTESMGNLSFGGGALHVRNGNVVLEHCTFENNKADGVKDGENVGAGGAVSIYMGTVSIQDTVFSGNEAHFGGAIYVRAEGQATVELTDCTFTGNTATYGSALFISGNNTVTVSGTEFTGNEALKNGTIFLQGADLTLTDTSITDNKGGLFVSSAGAALTVYGKNQIENNTKAAGTGRENVYFKTAVKLHVGALAEGTVICVSTATPVTEDPDDFLALAENAVLADTENTGIFYDLSQLRPVGYKAGDTQFYFPGGQIKVEDQSHCLCAGCAEKGCDHTAQTWTPWYSVTSLPTEAGRYYLVNDVQLEKTAQIKADKANVALCLNGKTVTAADKGAVYVLSGKDAKLIITDCAGGGMITGATVSAIQLKANTELVLYAGSICDNDTTDGGGAVALQKAPSTLRMYGGTISGNSAKSGGGVYVAAGCTMELYGGAICGNTAYNNFGGGIRCLGTLRIYGGTVNGNTAAKRGGGIYQEGAESVGLYEGGTISGNMVADTGDQGGGLCMAGGTATLSGVKITENKLPAAGNGAGVTAGGKATVTMTAGEISGHTAKNGAAVVVAGGSAWTMTGGVIENNEALADEKGKGGEGGGIYVAKNSVLTISGGKIQNNTAAGSGGAVVAYDGSCVTMTGGRVEANIAQTKSGGGLYVVNAQLELKGGAIVNNQTLAENGAGLSTSGKCKVTLEGTEICGNKAAKNAGGILIAGAGSTFTFISGTVSDNQAGKTGGGIFLSKNVTMDMQGGTVKNNTAKEGGGLCVYFAEAAISGGEITGNAAQTYGGGMLVTETSAAKLSGDVAVHTNTASMGAGVCVSKASSMEMTGGLIHSNTAETYGGGVALMNDSALTLSDGQLRGNTARSGGAILLNSGSALVLEGNASINGNRATTGYGGAIAAASTGNKVSVTMTGGTIADNTAKKTGGGIHMAKGILSMSGGRVSGNTADSTGGGLYFIESTATLSGGTISGNATKTTGGGVGTSLGTTLNLQGTAITGNYATETGGCGGGVILMGKGSVMNFSAGSISQNRVAKSGGGLYVSKNTTLNMSGGTVGYNYAGESGGGIILGLCTTNITGGAVTGNTSSGTAGGISNSGKCLMNISGLTISDNYAEKAGGGIVVVTRDSVLNMTDCVIENNVSNTNNGGGLYQSRYNTINLTNVKFIGNTAAKKGGGLYLAGDQANLKNVTMDGNEAVENGGGLLLETWSNLFADGLEVHNNNTTKHGGGMYLTAGTSTELRNGNFTGNKAGERGAAIWAGADLIMHSLKVTGNTSGKLGTVYLADNKFDGQSYMSAFYAMSGDMIITDNPGEGKDLYLSGVSCLSISAPGLGKNAKIGISLKEGLLTDKVYGEYDYEGGNLEYVITYGSRSVTEPELPVTEPTEPEQTQPENEPTQQPTTDDQQKPAGAMWPAAAAIGAAVVAAAAVVLILVSKRKKQAKTGKEN